MDLACCIIIIELSVFLTISAHSREFLPAADGDLFPVSIIHLNDFHARFEETNEVSTSCRPNEKCIGGYARAITTIKHLQTIHRNTNPIYVNAGDNFEGTLWYNMGRWNVTSYFLNLLPADAITLGNHDFAHKIDGLLPFIESLKSPIVVCNIDDSMEFRIQGKYSKSIIIDRYERKIGIIGVILATTNIIAATENLRFTDESTAVRAEAAQLKSQGVNIIIVVSHCGLSVDYRIAQNAGADIDVIVGGHSHSFMFSGANSTGPDRPQDEYPAVVYQNGGHKVLIVQASAYTKYIGDLTVYFDLNGEVSDWIGNPLFLDTDIQQDEDIVRELLPWQEIIDLEANRTIGSTLVTLQRTGCNVQECNLGNLVTDSYVNAFVDLAEMGEWTYAAIAIITFGGMRTSLNVGDLSFGDLVTVLPFENTLNTIELTGQYVLEMLEHSVSNANNENHMLQLSGIKVVYNLTNPVGLRVISALALCNKCDMPEYKPIINTEVYRIIVQSYLADGGSGYDVFQKYGQNIKVHLRDIDAFESYVRRISPIMYFSSGRITIVE